MRLSLKSQESLNPKIHRSKGVSCSPRTDKHTDTQTDRVTIEVLFSQGFRVFHLIYNQGSEQYRGHPFRVSGFFPITYYQWSDRYRGHPFRVSRFFPSTYNQGPDQYRGHPFRVSRIFPSTYNQGSDQYRGHPFRVSGFFPSTYNQGSDKYRGHPFRVSGIVLQPITKDRPNTEDTISGFHEFSFNPSPRIGQTKKHTKHSPTWHTLSPFR